MQILAANSRAAFESTHVHPSFWWRIEHCPTAPKFLVPESWAENLGRVPWALRGAVGERATLAAKCRSSKGDAKHHTVDGALALLPSRDHTFAHASLDGLWCNCLKLWTVECGANDVLGPISAYVSRVAPAVWTLGAVLNGACVIVVVVAVCSPSVTY